MFVVWYLVSSSLLWFVLFMCVFTDVCVCVCLCGDRYSISLTSCDLCSFICFVGLFSTYFNYFEIVSFGWLFSLSRFYTSR